MFVSFHDIAMVELNEAAKYYEGETAGLGQAFVTEVERCANESFATRRQVSSFVIQSAAV